MLGPLLVQFLRVGWSVYLKPCWEKKFKKEGTEGERQGDREGGRKEGREEDRRDRQRQRVQRKPTETQRLCAISSSGSLRCKLALC